MFDLIVHVCVWIIVIAIVGLISDDEPLPEGSSVGIILLAIVLGLGTWALTPPLF